MLFVKSFFKDAVVRADKRTDGSVDVLVGNKYGGFNKNAKTTYVGQDQDRLPRLADPDPVARPRRLSSSRIKRSPAGTPRRNHPPSLARAPARTIHAPRGVSA